MRHALVLGVLAALLVPAAQASTPPTGFAFGRSGGNIMPFRVVVSNDGKVHVSGAASAKRAMLTSHQLINLNRVATMNMFASLPKATQCKGVLPDVATTFVRVGPTTVRVHGGCLPRYQHVWKALGAAVGLAP